MQPHHGPASADCLHAAGAFSLQSLYQNACADAQYAAARRSYVIVAWIWSFLFYLPLDLIKWGMAYALNEDGFRDRLHGKKPTNVALETENVDLPPQSVIARKPQIPDKGSLARTSVQKEAEKNQQSIPGGPVTWTNPMGRHSMSAVSQQQVCVLGQLCMRSVSCP